MRHQPGAARLVRRMTTIGAVLLGVSVLVAVLPKAHASGDLIVTPQADAYVRSDQATTNFGTKYVLDAQASSPTTPTQLTYVRFAVTGVSSAPASVQLRLYTYSAATQGLQVFSADNGWTESAITYDNAPAPGSTMVGAIPTITSNTWATLDVSNVVTGNGTYTFVIETTATANKQMGSRESTTSGPELVVKASTTPASITAAGGSGQSTTAGTSFSTALLARVTDSTGAGVPNVPVTFTAPDAGASGTFAGGTAAVSVSSDQAGQATAPAFTANSTSGSYAVTAATPGIATKASFALTNASASATSSAPPSSSSTPSSTPSSPTGSPSSSSGAGSTTTSFAMSADSYVRSDQPDANFGAKYVLATEASSSATPTITTYLTSTVKNLTGAVTSATLQLYSYATSSLGVKVSTTSSNWTESGLTYNNAPAVGATVGTGPNIVLNSWASIDMTSTVSKNGTYSFAVTTARTADNQFGSRESGFPPKLVVTTTPSATSPTPSPTPTPTSPSPSPSPSTSTTGSTVSVVGGGVQSAMVGAAFAAPLAVNVRSSDGTPLSGAAVTFTAPATGASAAFPGAAATVTVQTDSAGNATSPPVTANPTAGTYSVTASTNSAAQSAAFTLTNTDPTIVAAGDIACTASSTITATSCQQVATSDLAITLHPDYVLPLGDDQYELGSLSDYQQMYDPSWGRLNAISYPVPGNHEYGYIGSAVEPTGGAGYFTYFGDRSHPLQPGCTSMCTSWYSYNIGSWHIVALDSQCSVIGGCNPGNAEYNWLQADLKANTAKCTLAYWHIPLYSSSQDHQPDMQSIFGLLYSKGVDVALTGHAHFYERFGPQDAAGNAQVNGVREFIVGSGGRNFFAIRQTPAANSEARIANTFGVLQMTLSSNSYSWRFVAANGATATDSGSATCT
jgi:hypothetical protein